MNNLDIDGALATMSATTQQKRDALAVLCKYAIGDNVYYVDRANNGIRKLVVRAINLMAGASGNIGVTYNCSDVKIPGKTPTTYGEDQSLYATLEEAMESAWGAIR
jgi:hypothetical protein